MIVVAIGVVLAIVFAILIIYYTAFATGHPHIKHDALFIVLALGSLLVAWFAWPNSRTP